MNQIVVTQGQFEITVMSISISIIVYGRRGAGPMMILPFHGGNSRLSIPNPAWQFRSLGGCEDQPGNLQDHRHLKKNKNKKGFEKEAVSRGQHGWAAVHMIDRLNLVACSSIMLNIVLGIDLGIVTSQQQGIRRLSPHLVVSVGQDHLRCVGPGFLKFLPAPINFHRDKICLRR